MHYTKIIGLLFLVAFLAACNKEKVTPNPVDPTDPGKPAGTFQALRSGVFQKQNGYNAEGTAQLGADDNAVQWLRLTPDFKTTLATGTVTVYLSKNQNLMLNSANSFLRVSLVTTNGEHFFKVDPVVDIDFKFVVLWCAPAGVQFGNAELN